MADPHTGAPWGQHRLGGLAYAVPDGWTVQESTPGRLTVHVAPEQAGEDSDGHRPVLVATVEPCSVTAAQYSTQTMSDMMAHLPLLHVLDVARWAPPGVDPVQGRRIEFLHAAGGASLHAVQYVFVDGGTAASVTVTCSERHVPDWDEVLWAMGDSVRVLGPTTHTTPEGPRPAGMPRLAEYASVRYGAPLEALRVVAAEQPFRAAGPVLSDDAAALLLDLATGRGAGTGRPAARAGRIAPHLDAAPLEELVRAGVADTDGRLTAQGHTVVGPLRNPVGRATLSAHHGGEESRLALFHGRDGQALLLGQPPLATARGGRETGPRGGGGTHLELLPVWLTPSVAAAWVGLGPAWTTDAEAVPVAFAEFDRRIRKVTDPPRGLPTSLAVAWSEPWVVWQAAGDGGSATYLGAGESGHHLVESDGAGQVLLTPVPARNVYRHLAALLAPAGAGYALRQGA
ncbi:MAG TPA: hypothetical protein VIG75_05210 [Citricoccus sp.]